MGKDNMIDITPYFVVTILTLYILYTKFADDKCYVFGQNNVCSLDVFILMGICMFLIGYVGLFTPFRNMLGKVYISDFIDGWIISHFLLYMYLGYAFPDKLMYFTLVGILWEGFEQFMSIKNHNIKLFGVYLVEDKYNKNTDWWYARTIDIVANTLGYATGQLFNKYASGTGILQILKNEMLV